MKKEDRFPLFCLLIIIAAFIIGSINPIYFESWFAESLFTIILVLLLAIFYINKKFRFSNLSYALITLYLILHTIGSHYTYPETPIGFWISSIFGFTRNHYDRIIHFLWGLLIYIPALEITKHLIPIKKQKANLFYYLVPVFALISLGAFKESHTHLKRHTHTERAKHTQRETHTVKETHTLKYRHTQWETRNTH